MILLTLSQLPLASGEEGAKKSLFFYYSLLIRAPKSDKCIYLVMLAILSGLPNDFGKLWEKNVNLMTLQYEQCFSRGYGVLLCFIYFQNTK